MGVVYLGVAKDGDQVAVKVLRPELADDPEFRIRFCREVATLLRVKGVCTVRVIEADTDSPRPFLVTEYADGPSLAEYINMNGPLGDDMLYGLATGLAEALTAIHAAGVVHRDLKPSNILLTEAGPKVIDFGIAYVLDATAVTRTGMMVGSAGFMAPEQIMGHAGTPADIFTWAVTVGYAASGRPPFGTGSSDVILYRIMHAEPDITAVPALLRSHVQAALARRPDDRPAAHQLLSQLTHTPPSADSSYDVPTRTVLSQTWRPATAGAGASAASRPHRLVPVLVTLTVLGAVAGSAVALYLAERSATTHTNAPATAATRTHGTRSAGSVSASTARPTATASPALPVITVGSYTGTYPAELAFSGDAGNVVSGITWTSWTPTGAVGYGKSDIDSCIPSCAQAPANFVVAAITLSDPIHGRFTLLVEKRNGTTETYHYPRVWPQYAQQVEVPP